MTLADLKTALAAITHGLTETNVRAVGFDGRAVVIDCRDPDEDRLAELREDLEAAERAEKEASALANSAEAERDRLTVILDDLKHNGRTVKDYAKDADEAHERARRAELDAAACLRELTALRKRRGLPAGLFRNCSAVLAALHNCPDKWAQDLVTKIHADK